MEYSRARRRVEAVKRAFRISLWLKSAKIGFSSTCECIALLAFDDATVRNSDASKDLNHGKKFDEKTIIARRLGRLSVECRQVSLVCGS
jgi:hypothetical protein